MKVALYFGGGGENDPRGLTDTAVNKLRKYLTILAEFRFPNT